MPQIERSEHFVAKSLWHLDWFCTGISGEINWDKLSLETVLANNLRLFNFATRADIRFLP